MNVLHSKIRYHERLSAIAEYIDNNHIDVICLQELRNADMTWLNGLFSQHGYRLLYLEDIMHDTSDTVGIAYRRKTISLDMTYSIPGTESIGAVMHTMNDSIFDILSYHGYWGCDKQSERLYESHQIASYYHGIVTPVIVHGDFNAEPHELCIQYMLGNRYGYNDEWTYWLEAQDYCKNINEDYRIQSTTANTGLGAETAHAQGIDESLFPQRRIDYIFTKGWVYGKSGGFTSYPRLVREFNGQDADAISDHIMITTTIHI